MELKLKYNAHATHQTAGAFIRGSDVRHWLRVISEWNVLPHQLTCLILSERNDPQSASGLFVIFNSTPPALASLEHPYRVTAGKLFLPIDAELSPQVDEQELKSMLIWDYQVLHPVLGFTGFDKSDEVQLADMLAYPQPVAGKWDNALQGLSPAPRLREIYMQEPTPSEVFEEVKDSVNSKDLKEIPKEGKRSPFGGLTNALGRAGLKTGLVFTRMIIDIFGSPGGNRTLVNNADDWMNNKLKDLEKERDNELKRLLNMFDKNTDEALEYAIPLDSPYLNRGTGQGGGTLQRRPINFNLGRLGGGGAVSYWAADHYYMELRRKYEEAAQRAIAAKDFKKAAYVYAHLLGDFHAAANTLEQGKYYREAAVLYKDHLKNIPSAAECLERGGLLLDAIELYEGLGKSEKVGDLYTILGQETAAAKHYQQSVHRAFMTKDHLDAARILETKLHDRPEAKKMLLQGWDDVKQPEACLTRYFRIEEQEENKSISTAVKSFYHQGVDEKRTGFLNVLSALKKDRADAEFDNTARDIAYEIVSREVEDGRTRSLHQLKNFIPDDDLLSDDCTRYASTHRAPVKLKQAPGGFKLYKNVRWTQLIPWRQVCLAVGIQEKGLCIARFNWEHAREYHTWDTDITSAEEFVIFSDPNNSNNIIIYSRNPKLSLDGRAMLPNNSFPEEMIITFPGWLRTRLIGLDMSINGYTTLHAGPTATYLHFYDLQGNLLSSVECFMNNEPLHLREVEKPQQMIFREGFYYVPYGSHLLRITHKGVIEMFSFSSSIKMISGTPEHTRFKLVVATDNGCILLFPEADGIKLGNDYFATGITITDMKFLPDSKLLIAADNCVAVYSITRSVPEDIFHIDTAKRIIGIVPGPQRNEVGIMEEDGRITRQKIEFEE